MCGDSNDFVIPKGLDYSFTVQILQDNSFLPQTLDNFSVGTLKIIDMVTGDVVAGVPVVNLTKKTEDTVDAVLLVQEETDLSIATLEAAMYSISINGTTYNADFTGGVGATLAAIAAAFDFTVLPENVTVTVVGSVLTIKNAVGQVNTITYSTNIAKTRYVAGVEAVAGYTKTTYNDNGYLEGTIPALSTGALEVSRGGEEDKFYLKPNYQGILQVSFSDGTPTKTALICAIYVVYTGN